jgi:cyclophilin family peptidyl-prolyl cis-trans isomerase
VVRQETEAELLLVSKRPGALDELLRWADPGASQRGGLHAATWLTILGGLEGREDPKLDPWLMGFLAGGYGIDRLERPYVVSEAVSLIGRNHRFGLARALLDLLQRAWAGPPPHDEIRQQALDVEVRKALMDAFADLAGATGCPPEIAAAMLAALRKHMLRDPSPWVRRKAREAARTLGLKDVPERDEVGQPNAWRGIPRVVETTGEDGEPQRTTHWLHEDEIVVLADLLAAAHARVVFETSVGPFTVALDPEDAPAHCVSLVTAVANGIYRHTRWHRVVPDFVIQGGDPHGTGAGDGGWTVPDEITRHPFVRGALGMPKSTKDDGGCQIFVMHAAYPPLDGRYTCYGQVTDGMDAVDAIRVGDFLLSARVVLGGR